MEIRRLQYFVRIAEDGSLTKAAGMLRIAQPALSRQIRLLEEELGVTLFNRSARGMRLTAEGEHLHASAAGPLRELELALQDIRSFSARVEGDFTIGMPTGLSDIVAHRLIVDGAAELPHIRLRIIEGPGGSLIDWMNRGIVDFAFVEHAAHDDRLNSRALLAEPLLLAGAPHKRDWTEPVTFREMAALPLILPTHHLGIRGTLDEAARRARLTLDCRFEVDAARLIRQLAAEGMGYAVLPRSAIRRELASATLACCAIAGAELRQECHLVSRSHSSANARVSGKVEAFLTALFNAAMQAPEALPDQS